MTEPAMLQPTLLLEYAGLRHAGYPAWVACRNVGALGRCFEMEAAFIGRARAGGRNAMLPTRADDDRHVGAVRAECGVYPVLWERKP